MQVELKGTINHALNARFAKGTSRCPKLNDEYICYVKTNLIALKAVMSILLYVMVW